MEELREALEADHHMKKKIRIEKIKINSEALKLNKLIASRDDWSESEKAEFDKTAEMLNERVEELKGLYNAVTLDIKAKEQKFTLLSDSFCKLDGTQIYPYEVLRMLNKDLNGEWSVEWIKSHGGIVLGYAFVREDDERFKKSIVADFSISNNTINVQNSASRKVVYANLKYDANDVLKSWDWMDFYIYAVIGLWKNDEMKQLFDDFIARDYDFAECVCLLIRENFMRTDEEVLNEIIGK